jgi:hypothetical protein
MSGVKGANVDLDELIGGSDAADFLIRTAADWIDRQCYVPCRDRHIEPMGRRNGTGGAIEIELQRVVKSNGDARLRVPCRTPQNDRRDFLWLCRTPPA